MSRFRIERYQTKISHGWRLVTPWGAILAYVSHLGAYMRRWIIRRAAGTLRLHNVRRSDGGRDFHDHPFDFTSLILWGGYVEHRPGCVCNGDRHGFKWNLLGPGRARAVNDCRFYGPGSIVRRRAEDFHRLELVNGPAWTLVVTGPYRRPWGFQTPTGWVPFQEYGHSYDSP